MIFFRRRPEPPSATDLLEVLSGPWVESRFHEAFDDRIDPDGWLYVYDSPVGTLLMRRGHAEYPDGLAWVEKPARDASIWYFLLNRDGPEPTVDIAWRRDFQHETSYVMPTEAKRYALGTQHCNRLVAGIRELDAKWAASLAWTEQLSSQFSETSDSPWMRWFARCQAMQEVATRRGWKVTALRAAPPATEAELVAVEQAHGVRIPVQLRQLLGEVAAEVHFGWFCAADDEPAGIIAELYGGGIRGALWSLEAIDCYALGGIGSWCEYHRERAREFDIGMAESEPEVSWEQHFAFSQLKNGDLLTIDTSNPDPVAQPVRYFSHEADGKHGAILAPNLFAFYEVWCELGCAGSEQASWWHLHDPETGFLSADCAVAREWRDWLVRDPDLREPDEAPRPILARSAADFAWLEAARNQDMAAMEQALELGARVDCSVDDWRHKFETAVVHAVRNDNMPMLQWLHAQGASLSTPLLSTQVAVRYASPAVLQWLIEHGARVDRWRHQRFCPIHELINSERTSEDYRALMALLLDGGADPDAFYDLESIGARTTPLMRVGPWTARRLLAAGADPHKRDRQGCTALHWARYPEVIELLVEAGLDPNVLSTPDDDEPGRTPIQLALRSDDATLAVPAFLAVGADPEHTDTRGCSAWFYCFDSSCVDLLLSLGADVNAQDPAGKTLLHHLLCYSQRLYGRYLETAERLVQRGLDVNLADEHGDTPLHVMARSYGRDHPSLEFLLRHGADKRLRNRQGLQAWECVGAKARGTIRLLKPTAW